MRKLQHELTREERQRLVEYLDAPSQAIFSLALLRQYWDRADSDSKANCPPELVPEGW